MLKKRVYRFFNFCWLLATVTVASAHGGFYAGFNGGVALPGNNNNAWWQVGAWNTGYVLDAHGGYWYKTFRFEGEMSFFNHRLVQASNWTVGITTVMGNVYYDFKYGNYFIPFLGVGAGWLHSWLGYYTQFTINNPAQNSFAYQGMAGFTIPFNPNIGINIDYRFLEWTNAPGYDSAVEVGLNFFF